MKVIGLLGGMSWESTIEYYRIINQEVRRRLGRQHSAKVLMYSVEFEEIEKLQDGGEWDRAGQLLASEAARLQRGGADFILLCTNTMHRVAPAIQAAVSIPLVHIADATAARIKAANTSSVGLLGTRFTMEGDFYKGRLADEHYSFMGYQERGCQEWRTHYGPELVRRLQDAGVHALILAPA